MKAARNHILGWQTSTCRARQVFDLLERELGSAPRFKTLPFMFLTALADRDNELTGWRHGG
jgi:hypothetical protein